VELVNCCDIIMDITELKEGKFYKYNQSDLDEDARGNCDLFDNNIAFFKVISISERPSIVLYYKDGTTKSQSTTLTSNMMPITISHSCFKHEGLGEDEEPKVFTEVPRGATNAPAAGRRRTKKKAKKRKSLASRGTKSRR